MPAEAIAARSRSVSVREEVAPRSIETREHEANLWRLKAVLGIGLLLWSVIGIPNDWLVTRTFDLSYREFTIARVVSTAMQIVAFIGFLTRPGPRMLRLWESILFVGTAGGLAALNHGPGGPTPIFLSCALLAQGIAVPRPWRAGLVMLGITYLAYPISFLVNELVTHRNRAFYGDVDAWFAFGHTLFLAAVTGAFLVYGGDAFWALRRRALEAQRIGRYRLRRKLGGGGMGEVWLADHPGLGRAVALKLARGDAEPRLATEIELLSVLSHPSTVRLVDRGRTDDGRLYCAMEHIDGRTVAESVAVEGPMSAARTLHVVTQIARALAEAHALGIVHRDVKPENVMLVSLGSERDFAKLIDFGLALRLGDSKSASEERSTRAGRIVGSPLYMAPEQRQGGEIDARVDVFALGAVACFALSGRSPLDDGLTASLRSLAEDAELSMLPRNTPADLRAVLVRCLALDPALRPRDANEAAELFAACRDAGSWS